MPSVAIDSPPMVIVSTIMANQWPSKVKFQRIADIQSHWIEAGYKCKYWWPMMVKWGVGVLTAVKRLSIGPRCDVKSHHIYYPRI